MSGRFGERTFDWAPELQPGPPGDWENYIRAAAQAVSGEWGPLRGIEAEVFSDLPPAAGLSSSSALLTGFTLALLRANGIEPKFEELMDILPEGEHFVGTRGGGMDHAAVLAAEAAAALLIRFAPVRVESVRIPEDWAFLAAHSLVTAEKSGELRAEYNARRTAGNRSLAKLGLSSFADALTMPTRIRFPNTRFSVGVNNAARLGRAITSSKCRSSIMSSIRMSRRRSDWKRTWSA